MTRQALLGLTLEISIGACVISRSTMKSWLPCLPQIYNSIEVYYQFVSGRRCIHTLIKSNYGRYNRLVYGICECWQVFFLFVAGNPYFNKSFFGGVDLIGKKTKKMGILQSSQIDNLFVYGRCSCWLFFFFLAWNPYLIKSFYGGVLGE